MVAQSLRVLFIVFPLPLIIILTLPLRKIQPAMSSDSFMYPLNENKDAFFAPPPPQADAPSPESFDSEEDWSEVDNKVAELDFNWSFDQFDDFYSTYRDSIPVNPTPALTYATDSSYENTLSQYSNDFSPSVYSNPSEFETHSFVNDGVYTIDEFIHSAMLSDYQPSLPTVDTIEAQSDNGIPDLSNFVEMSPGDLPAVQQSAFPAISAQVEPFKPFKCPQCPFCMSEPAGDYNQLTRLASFRT